MGFKFHPIIIPSTSENVQEVANDDSLDDLFPDGLADTAHDLPKDAEEPEGAEGAEDEDEPPPFAWEETRCEF